VFRFIIVVLFVALVLTVFLSSHYSFAVGNVKCEDGYTHTQWDPKDHGSNTRSSNEFKMLAYKGSLCELAKCVDMVECTDHDTVDWQKFKNSPAFYLSEKEYKECLTNAHKQGNGQDGLVGYEILDCVNGKYE
jgi:hypothetical protein